MIATQHFVCILLRRCSASVYYMQKWLVRRLPTNHFCHSFQHIPSLESLQASYASFQMQYEISALPQSNTTLFSGTLTTVFGGKDTKVVRIDNRNNVFCAENFNFVNSR